MTTTPDDSIPTLYDWLGGIDALQRLTTRFYENVKRDALLAPVFAHMSGDHPAHVAAFLAEVLGGPATYSEQHGGHPHMVRQHLNRHLAHEQRHRWVGLLLETADELDLPDDPEFRSALVGYLEWGSRLAVINSQPRCPDAPMGLGRSQGPVPPLAGRGPGGPGRDAGADTRGVQRPRVWPRGQLREPGSRPRPGDRRHITSFRSATTPRPYSLGAACQPQRASRTRR